LSAAALKACRLPQRAVERRALGCQFQLAGTPIAHAGLAFDIAARQQVVEHAIEALFRDLEDGQQVRHRKPGIARNEIQGAAVRAAQPGGPQLRLALRKHVAEGEEQQVHPLLQLVVPKI
jgi:hypothetical protein